MTTEELRLQTNRGLEQVLLEEAGELGQAHLDKGGVFLEGPSGLHRAANLQLRTAIRVWLRVGRRWVDTTGEPLSRRGYRLEGSRAPLSETLAAGLLSLARTRPETPVWDPLCGSGTIVIEAALRARGLAPGLGRRFAFETFEHHDAASFAAEKAALQARAFPRALASIIGGDLNAGALGTARRNARRAGVLSDLRLERRDATEPKGDLEPGTQVVTNLPYGQRVGDPAALAMLYGQVARALRESGVERAAFLAKDARAAAWLELSEAVEHPVDNGGLACRLIVGRP